jgi:hypothetical protein
MMQPDRMGFFGGHVEGVSGGHGVFVRDDGVSFPWSGIAPFLPDADGNSWPAYCNRAVVPGAPHNVPGARRDVWSYGPNPCLYAGKYQFQVPLFSDVTIGWLFPIAPGEVLWIGAPAGAAMADLGSSSARPAFNVVVSGDRLVLSPKWAYSSLDGRCAVIYDGKFFYDATVSVEKKSGITNEKTSSKIRYDVFLTYTRYPDSVGRVLDVEKNTATDVDFINLSTDENVGFVSIDGNQTQLIKQITHYKYSCYGKPLFEYRHDFIYGVPNGYVKELAIEKYLQDHGMDERIVTVNVCGQTEIDSKPFPRTSLVGYRFYIYPCNMFYGTVVELVDGAASSVVRNSFFGNAFDGVKTPPDQIVKKNSDSLIIRAISPEKVYLSDSDVDKSFFFV